MMSDEHNTLMLPRVESRIQVIGGLKAEVVANCDHLRHLTAERLARGGRQGLHRSLLQGRVGIKASGKDCADRLICSTTFRSFEPSE